MTARRPALLAALAATALAVLAGVVAVRAVARPAPIAAAGGPPPASSRATWGSGGTVYFVSPAVGWAMEQSQRDSRPLGLLYRTADGGITWTKQLEWTGTAPVSVTFSSPTAAVVAVRVQNEVLRVFATSDGVTWRWSDAPPDAGSIAFVSPGQGWYAERSQGRLVVERTADGGRSWRAQASLGAPAAVDPYLWMRFLDPKDGMMAVSAVGAGAAVYATHDGGATWAVVPLPAPPGATPQARVVASAMQPAGGSGAFVGVDVYAHESDSAARHFLYYSPDAGRTWSGPRGLPGTRWQALDAHHLAAASGPLLYRSSTGGRSWSDRTTSLPAAPQGSGQVTFGPYTFAGVEFLDDRLGWATAVSVQECLGPAARPSCREHPQISSASLTTTDGGATWTAVHPGP